MPLLWRVTFILLSIENLSISNWYHLDESIQQYQNTWIDYINKHIILYIQYICINDIKSSERWTLHSSSLTLLFFFTDVPSSRYVDRAISRFWTHLAGVPLLCSRLWLQLPGDFPRSSSQNWRCHLWITIFRHWAVDGRRGEHNVKKRLFMDRLQRL